VRTDAAGDRAEGGGAETCAKVTLAGRQDAVEPWFQAMDVFCLPSYANEGVPQAVVAGHALRIARGNHAGGRHCRGP